MNVIQCRGDSFGGRGLIAPSGRHWIVSSGNRGVFESSEMLKKTTSDMKRPTSDLKKQSEFRRRARGICAADPPLSEWVCRVKGLPTDELATVGLERAQPRADGVPAGKVAAWILDNDFGGQIPLNPIEDCQRLSSEMAKMIGGKQKEKAPDNQLLVDMARFWTEMSQLPFDDSTPCKAKRKGGPGK